MKAQAGVTQEQWQQAIDEMEESLFSDQSCCKFHCHAPEGNKKSNIGWQGLRCTCSHLQKHCRCQGRQRPCHCAVDFHEKPMLCGIFCIVVDHQAATGKTHLPDDAEALSKHLQGAEFSMSQRSPKSCKNSLKERKPTKTLTQEHQFQDQTQAW